MSVTLKLHESDALAIAIALECMASGIDRMDNAGKHYDAPTLRDPPEDTPEAWAEVEAKAFYDGVRLVLGEHLLLDNGDSNRELTRLSEAFHTAVKANAPNLYGLVWPDVK